MLKDKIRLGYTNEYVYIGDLNKQKGDDLVRERNIKCSYCGKKLRRGDWVAILHIPSDKNKPRRLHFFCHAKNCHYEWGLKSQKEREG